MVNPFRRTNLPWLGIQAVLFLIFVVMTRVLPIALSALMLAGCADGYDKSAGIDDCKGAAPADRLNNQLSLSDTNTIGHNFAGIQSRNLPGGSGRLAHGTGTAKCAHNEDNKGIEPKNLDLQKIGAARLSAIQSRPA
ncbi:MAG TPA: hypothetical protein VFI23_03705 [Rhizomicrobium sp.]|nr:hypothetical protein [Rhizomicrobium sp.]